MNARETAHALSPAEFIVLCSYLDAKYKEEARYFDVSEVRRSQGVIDQIVVELRWGAVIVVNASAISDQVMKYSRNNQGVAA